MGAIARTKTYALAGALMPASALSAIPLGIVFGAMSMAFARTTSSRRLAALANAASHLVGLIATSERGTVLREAYTTMTLETATPAEKHKAYEFIRAWLMTGAK